MSDPLAALRVSVTDLVARAGSGGILFPAPGFLERLALGSLLHRRHQESALAADPSYRYEVALSAVVEHDGRRVRIEGRADGIRTRSDGVRIVEELKTAAGSAPSSGERLALERLQVELYAWLLARADGAPVEAALVWLELGREPGGDAVVVARAPVPIDLDDVERRLRALLDGVVRDARRREAWDAHRRAQADGLAMPFETLRKGQAEIGAAVERAIAERRHLLLEAPTGIGKTAAVLVPALRHAFRSGGRILLLTSRGTQQRGVLAALDRIVPAGSAAAVQLRPKAELCATGTLLCHEDDCAFAHRYARKRDEGDLVQRLFDAADVIRPEAALAVGRAAEACPHALARDAAAAAVLAIGDLNYAVDPAVMLPELAPWERLDDWVLLVDEAHQLPDRARDARSAELSRDALHALAEAAAAGGAPAHDALRASALALAHGVEEIARDVSGAEVEGDGELEWEMGPDTLAAERAALAEAVARYVEYRLATRTLAPRHEDAALELARGALAFGDALDAAGPGTATSVAWERGAPRLRVHCLEPERELAKLFARFRSVVAFSATLRPFALRAAVLGLPDDRTDTLALSAPFPAERRAIVIDKRADTRLRARGREAPRLAKRLAAFATSVPGHVLALAPSFAWIEALRAELAPLGRIVLAQSSRDDRAARERLFAALAGAAEPPVLLLAVAGGVFGEGVEWPGTLSGVAVIGPCLPPPNLARELLRRRYEERFGSEDGFTLAYALPGMTRVIQGAGRLIRSERDRGVVALFDRRFLEEPWRSLLPPDWLAGGSAEDRVGDPAKVSARFFAGA
jgi:DNA excision repair protein ERCC-2